MTSFTALCRGDLVLVLLVYIGLSQWLLSARKRHDRPYLVYGLIFHLICACGYYFFTLMTPIDSNGYYEAARLSTQWPPLLFGTKGIVWLTYPLVHYFSLSYAGCFLVYALISYRGLLYIYNSYCLVTQQTTAMRWAPFIFLYPGLHFWTSMIGKDALFLFANGMVMYYLIRDKPLPALVGMGMAVFVRPHVGAVMILSYLLAGLTRYREQSVFLLILLAVASGGVVFFLIHVVSSIQGILHVLSTQSVYYEGSLGFLNTASSPWFVKVFGLWFRPLFLDARSAIQRLASVENSVLFVWLLYVGKRGYRSICEAVRKGPFFLRYQLIYVMGASLLLAYIVFNMGLAMRQKMMVIPNMILAALYLLTLASRPLSGSGNRPNRL